MPNITVLQEFRFSPTGLEVVTYAPGEHEVTELCRDYALRKGYAMSEGAEVLVNPPPQPEVVVRANAAPKAKPAAAKARKKA